MFMSQRHEQVYLEQTEQFLCVPWYVQKYILLQFEHFTIYI